MDESLTAADLVAAAVRGEQEAWNELVDRYLPLVRSVTRTYRLSDGDADDVSQTVWLRLVEHLTDIRAPAALPKWIITTTRNESLRVIKARRRTLPVDPLGAATFDAAADPMEVDGDLLRAERHQALRDGLSELAPQQRRLLLLLIADPPLSYREIGELLDMPVGSIGPTRARCLDQLRATSAMSMFQADGASHDKGGGSHVLTRAGRRR